MSDAKRIAVLSSAGGGGAGIAALRMARALSSSDTMQADFIDIATLGEAVSQSISPQDSFTNHTISDTHLTVEYPGYQRGWMVDLLDQNYDLVNVHWASYLISNSELLALALRGKPMLFMMHDFYYSTGGCHYPATCTQLGTGCLACPQVDTKRVSRSVIAENYKLKQKLFSLPNVHIAAPSAYLRDEVVKSGLVPRSRGHVLRNAYVPVAEFDVERPFSNRILLIADSLHEGRKNMRFALEVLASLRSLGQQDFMVDVVGTAAPEMKAYLAATGVRHVFHGRITDHAALAEIMQKTDVLLSASLEDNWPNILVEAGSYGCVPVVGPGHGCEEFVRRYGYGAVAEDYTIPSFVAALLDILSSHSAEARAQATLAIREEHAPANVARDFAALMDSMAAGERAGKIPA
ncbi:glycosyltransferase [Thalassobius vesicularis]|uniref:Glycosyltransferase n=1 Tax=Thalassobius vesicularis TaxID=1294297 RepID=A0A4S3MEM0_9RHOB|nr:glycosyltransferase [Thalassobius vesicularis]THD76937.1 glycosyltransferase [Thalassobius vesicularis]